MDIFLDNGNIVKICSISNTLDYAKAQPRKPMKMPLPPTPNGSAPALPPRRGVPPPPPPTVDQDEYDDFSVEDEEEAYDDFDVEDKTPPKPQFKPPAPPTEPEENYDEFEGTESPSGLSVYVMDDEIDEPPPPPPPPSARPKISKPPAHEEEYMAPDEDENISAGSHSSTGSSGPPIPGNRKPELPTRVEKPKKVGQSIFALDSSTLNNMKSKLKNVGFNKKPEKKNDEEKPNIFVNALKPEKNNLPVKPTPPIKPPPQTSNLKNKFLTKFSSKSKDMPPVPPVPTEFEMNAFQSNESHSHHSNSSHHEDQIDHSKSEVEEEDEGEIYDDATSQVEDPLMVHKWYHGSIDREESNKRLKSISSDGAFLVRKSTKDKSHPCTLAVMFQNHIQNLKVRIRDDGKYALGEYKENEVVFSSVPEVIEHHKKNDVILIGQKTGTVKLKETPKKY